MPKKVPKPVVDRTLCPICGARLNPELEYLTLTWYEPRKWWVVRHWKREYMFDSSLVEAPPHFPAYGGFHVQSDGGPERSLFTEYCGQANFNPETWSFNQ